MRRLYPIGAYLRAALISTSGKIPRGIKRELSDARSIVVHNLHYIIYVQLELLYEHGVKIKSIH